MDDEEEPQNSIMMSVLRRCTNPKALSLQGRCPEGLVWLLNEFCPKLEHITIGGIDNSKAENIEDVFEFKPANLWCFLMKQDWEDEEEEALASEFLDTCEHLQNFETSNASEPTIEMIIDKPLRWVGRDDDGDFQNHIEEYLEKCPPLHKLSFWCDATQDDLQLMVDSLVATFPYQKFLIVLEELASVID